MAIKQCPACGTQHRLTETICPECGADLVEVLASQVDPSPTGSDVGATIGAAIDERSAGAAPDDDAAGQAGRDGAGTGAGDDAGVGDEAGAGDGAGVGDEGAEHVTYEMGEWSSEARVMLEQLLTGAGVTRVWEGTDLVVRAGDESTVDDLVEEVRSADEPMLDPDAEKVVYEVNDWTTEQLVTLTDGLIQRGIGYQFDMEGDLVVLATDEDGVEALLDVIEFGPAPDGDAAGGASGPAGQVDGDDPAFADDLGGDADDGLVTAEILSDLFVACDKLQKNARDADGVLGVVNGAEKLAGRALPFGYEPRVWEGMIEAANGLSGDLAGDDATDEELEATARALRDRLRDYV